MKLIIYILIMSLTTYLIRMIPFVLFRKKIKSRFIKSFLFYIPYSVLGAMTIPYIFYSTDNIISSCVGCITALIMSVKNKSLIVVALAACTAAFITEIIISYVPM